MGATFVIIDLLQITNIYFINNICLRLFSSMRSRSAAAACSRPCHRTPRLVVRPAAAPPGGAPFPLTPRPCPPPRPLHHFRLLHPPAPLKLENAPLASLPPPNVKMLNEFVMLSPKWSV